MFIESEENLFEWFYPFTDDMNVRTVLEFVVNLRLMHIPVQSASFQLTRILSVLNFIRFFSSKSIFNFSLSFIFFHVIDYLYFFLLFC